MKKLILSIIATIFLLAPLLGTAQATEKKSVFGGAGVGLNKDSIKFLDNTGGEGVKGIQTTGTAKNAIVQWTNFILSFVAVIAVFFIVLGGFYYLTEGADEGNKDKGKKMIQGAVMGILIILSAYAIINTLIDVEVIDTTNTINNRSSSSQGIQNPQGSQNTETTPITNYSGTGE